MLIKTEALVLHSFSFKDNQRIVKLYTREKGNISAILRISNKKPSAKKALLQALTLVEVVVDIKEHSGLQNLKEISLWKPSYGISSNIIKQAQAMFIAELLLASIREEEKNEHLFDFLVNVIEQLNDAQIPSPDYHHAFMLDFTRYLGFYPDVLNAGVLPYFNLQEGCFTDSFSSKCCSKEETHLLSQYILSHGESIKNRTQRNVLISVFESYYRSHIPGFGGLKTPGVLNELF